MEEHPSSSSRRHSLQDSDQDDEFRPEAKVESGEDVEDILHQPRSPDPQPIPFDIDVNDEDRDDKKKLKLSTCYAGGIAILRKKYPRPIPTYTSSILPGTFHSSAIIHACTNSTGTTCDLSFEIIFNSPTFWTVSSWTSCSELNLLV